MKQQLLAAPTSAALFTAATELVQPDLIFVQHLGLVPKRLVSPNPAIIRPAAERKWLGADFSHVIVSQ